MTPGSLHSKGGGHLEGVHLGGVTWAPERGVTKGGGRLQSMMQRAPLVVFVINFVKCAEEADAAQRHRLIREASSVLHIGQFLTRRRCTEARRR